MSIKLRFEKGTLITQVVLKDAALGPLLALISEHQSDEVPLSAALSGGSVLSSAPLVIQATETSASVKEWIRKHTASEVLNQIKWSTNPEKILLLGAFHETNSKDEVWRSSDVEARFTEAREGFPSNFPRDISNAIKQNIIAGVTARTYRVSRVGWNKIKEAIEKLSEPAPLPSL